MANVIIYSTKVCPYCDRAKMLLKQKGADYTDIDVSQDESLREEMIEKSGGKRTVPQIFINDQWIGGSDALFALDQKGELDTLLEA